MLHNIVIPNLAYRKYSLDFTPFNTFRKIWFHYSAIKDFRISWCMRKCVFSLVEGSRNNRRKIVQFIAYYNEVCCKLHAIKFDRKVNERKDSIETVRHYYHFIIFLFSLILINSGNTFELNPKKHKPKCFFILNFNFRLV